MVVGLLCMAVGAFLFVPAASFASFPLFLGALIVLAAGITGLQVAANPYVVVLGKPETASSRLDLTQAFNSLGTTIAPKLGGLLILATAPLAAEEMASLSPAARHLYRVQQASSVKMPYTVIGIALLLLAVLIATSKLPIIAHAEYRTGAKDGDSVWKHPNLIFGALGIFAYVGAEVSIGSFLVNYFGQAEIAGLSAKAASGYVSFYWGGAMIGRFLGAGLLRKFRAGHLLGAFAICSSLLVSLSMLTNGHFAMWSMLAVGFFNSIMFPTIFSLGVAELGPLTGNGSGILNMAIVGGAIIPLIQGAIADRIGLHHAFFIPVICYLYILYYALGGSKPNSERYAAAQRDY
jgi:MFS transporter, FHS family, L-fucose permease